MKRAILRPQCVVTSRVSGPCATCRALTDTPHIPDEPLGIYCAGCCPLCVPARESMYHSRAPAPAPQRDCEHSYIGEPLLSAVYYSVYQLCTRVSPLFCKRSPLNHLFSCMCVWVEMQI